MARCNAGLRSLASACALRDCRRAPVGWDTPKARASESAINDLVMRGKIKAPVVIARDHLDCASSASPFAETEGMRDGSDAVADWPLLNALLNAASGATWVSIVSSGGTGIGYSVHAGQVMVADGTAEMAGRIERVLANDAALAITRLADAGYDEARESARQADIKIPMEKP